MIKDFVFKDINIRLDDGRLIIAISALIPEQSSHATGVSSRMNCSHPKPLPATGMHSSFSMMSPNAIRQ
jgi:hypothetical protein